MKEYLGRAVRKVVTVSQVGTFQSYYEASKVLDKEGKVVGSMCGGSPIGFANADKYNYIAKWHNIDPSDKNKLEGVLVSKDWREGSVDIIYFE